MDDTLPFMKGTEMAQAQMADVDEDVAAAASTAVRAASAPCARPEGVVLTGAAWIVTARKTGLTRRLAAGRAAPTPPLVMTATREVGFRW